MNPSQDPNPGRERAIARGRALVERHAHESPELGDGTDEQISAAGDLIADVLAYIATLPDDAFPARYGRNDFERVAAVAARGVWNTLAELLAGSDPGADPDPDVLGIAGEMFCQYLTLA